MADVRIIGFVTPRGDVELQEVRSCLELNRIPFEIREKSYCIDVECTIAETWRYMPLFSLTDIYSFKFYSVRGDDANVEAVQTDDA